MAASPWVRYPPLSVLLNPEKPAGVKVAPAWSFCSPSSDFQSVPERKAVDWFALMNRL